MLYIGREPVEGEPVQFLGVYALQWPWDSGVEPTMAFVEAPDSPDATSVAGLIAVCKRAEQLASIAYDWNLGDDGKVEIDGEWIDLLDLRDEFSAAIAKATGEAE